MSQEFVPHVPPDSAEYLEGDLPRYQSGGKWLLDDGTYVDMNKLQNPFDKTANPDDGPSGEPFSGTNPGDQATV